ncbi:hypothetical protein D3C78_1198640 [compost metagenome]
MGNGKHREIIDFIVVSRVIAVRPFRRHFALFDIPFEHNLCAGRHFQVIGNALHHFGFRTAQQASKSIFGKGVRNRRNRTENSGGIGSQCDRNRETFARMCRTPLLEIKRAAAMRQPTHNQLIFAD